jgi:uroporphyrinogen decarboxylase
MVQTKKPCVETLDELRRFSVPDIFGRLTAHPYYKTMARRMALLASRAGAEKLVMAFTPGPLTLAASFAGIEALLSALVEDRQLILDVLGFAAELCVSMLAYQADSGASAISIADPVSSVNVISAEFFETFSLPYLKRVTAALKPRGLPVMLHICGDTTSRLEPVKKAGIDIFSVDSIDLKNALSVARGHYTVFGTLSPVEALERATADEVYARAAALCRAAGPDGGFILAPGCDLTPDTPAENIDAMARAAYDTVW